MGFGFHAMGFGTVLAVFEGRLCDLQGRFQPRWGSFAPLVRFLRAPILSSSEKGATHHPQIDGHPEEVIRAKFFFSPR